MPASSGSLLIPIVRAYLLHAAQGELSPKQAALDQSRGNEEGLMVTSSIAHTAPRAADSGFLWHSATGTLGQTDRQGD